MRVLYEQLFYLVAITKRKSMAFPRQRRLVQPWWRSVDLSGIHTKVLLRLLQDARAHPRYDGVLPTADGTGLHVGFVWAELAKREHVLNKPENRLARQAKAKNRNRRRKVSGYRRPGHEA
jgi:hypothetical protein